MKTFFGPRLCTLRKAASLTQTQAAHKLGIDFTFLSKIENDKIPPSWETLKAMLSLYHASDEKSEWAYLHLMKTKPEQFKTALTFKL